jgi:hypothetical protein
MAMIQHDMLPRATEIRKHGKTSLAEPGGASLSALEARLSVDSLLPGNEHGNRVLEDHPFPLVSFESNSLAEQGAAMQQWLRCSAQAVRGAQRPRLSAFRRYAVVSAGHQGDDTKPLPGLSFYDQKIVRPWTEVSQWFSRVLLFHHPIVFRSVLLIKLE